MRPFGGSIAKLSDALGKTAIDRRFDKGRCDAGFGAAGESVDRGELNGLRLLRGDQAREHFSGDGEGAEAKQFHRGKSRGRRQLVVLSGAGSARE